MTHRALVFGSLLVAMSACQPSVSRTEGPGGAGPSSATGLPHLDSDGDTYVDLHEAVEGHDPLDPEDRIYQGYWPYNPHKADIWDPEHSAPHADDRLRNLVAVDQFGDEVQLYDFVGQGRDVVFMLVAAWCPDCWEDAEWIASGGTVAPFELEQDYGRVRRAIDSGELLWITVVIEDADGAWADAEDVVAWHEAYPHPRVAVVADVASYFWLGLPGWYSSGVLVDEAGEIVEVNALRNTMDVVLERLGDG